MITTKTNIRDIYWKETSYLPSKKYICGFCNNIVAPDRGYIKGKPGKNISECIFLCSYCERPTYLDSNENQTPGPIYGNKVNDIPPEVETLYNEARNCISCNANTASVLCSRKLLMNIAVSKGAKEGLNFIDYIDYLSKQNYIPPDGKDWVDHIRKKGNEATHEISIVNQDNATELIDFIEMLLKFVYEFPAVINRKSSASSKT